MKIENNIYLGDAETVLLENFPNECVDLTVTSPPYSDLRHYRNTINSKNWNHDKFKKIAEQLYRVTKNGGVIVWIVNDKTENGGKTLNSLRQALFFQEIGFNVNDVMIWEKTNPMPVVKQPRYQDVFEYMFILSKGKPKTFNPITEPCKCAGQEYHSTVKNIGGEDGRTYKEFNINKEKVKGNVWKIAVAQNKTIHPAVYPIQIAIDQILSWSNEGDLVLDPFMGSGTTAIACIKNNRKYVGIEINEDYYNLIKERIEKEKK